ncbi:MAG: hypothetical protein EBY22_16565 [Gammaproteobacteria bacterium]|nr:hypothetical protein [Gammaproteobacteria bacterium]
MAKRPLTYDDLLGNMHQLEQTIADIIVQAPEIWDKTWSVKLVESVEPETIATIEINVTVHKKAFYRELVILKVEKRKKIVAGFTVQWGSVPHPIIPIIFNWLKETDTSQERTILRTIVLKEELIKTACNKNEGI